MTTDSWPHGDMLLVAATLMEGAGDRGNRKGIYGKSLSVFVTFL